MQPCRPEHELGYPGEKKRTYGLGGGEATAEHAEGQVEGRRAAVKSEGGERRRRAARIRGFYK